MTETPPLKPITVTVATALSLTGLGRTKLYALIKEGRIRTISIGRRTLVVYASLEELIAPQKTGGDQ
jgi:excisionase family DNA binding protein